MMIETLPPLTELLVMLGALLVAGAGAGFIAGLLGIGGGIIIVPALYQVFSVLEVPADVRMHVAVGTSLATIVATGFRSARAHHRRGAVDLELLKQWLIPIIAGAVAGSVISDLVTGATLTAVFAVVALGIALQMTVVRPEARLVDRLPGQPVRSLMATVIGMIATMMGIGGGMLTVPTLRLCNYPTRNAVATASAVGFLIAVPATLGFIVAGWQTPGVPPLSLGYVNLLGFAIIAPVTVTIAPLGARVAHTIPQTALRVLFGIFLLVASGRLLYGSFVA
ncbi:Uncharacterized membrane protein YfcA [Limimonas halophila]|uniref:Probable membrane transporter protein n=2 Tax=Limimonas halophila TaxID=1082479 RepID=A0A1G7NWK0_9PROT|nr:Uncharacterized membrane protein YfcA [Limimonas halophila]